MPNNHQRVVEILAESSLFREYERAFTETTGLPIALRPVDFWQLPHHGRKNENAFCALMARQSRSCASCLRVQQQLSEAARREAATLTCPNGLTDSAVPILLGDQVIGFLQTGQVFRKPPTRAQFQRTLKLIEQWDLQFPRGQVEQLYFQTRVVPAKQYESIVRLLDIFGRHLSMVSNQVVVQQENAAPPMITRAKAYIQEHQAEKLSLGQVARAVNMSSFYFCKLFKRVLGINYTDYLARVRIEKAKNLLLNPNLRVSEIAYEVGFQSLTHFNRVFKKVQGQSPTQYRARLAGS